LLIIVARRYTLNYCAVNLVRRVSSIFNVGTIVIQSTVHIINRLIAVVSSVKLSVQSQKFQRRHTLKSV
jgi:hypothetical protein